MRNTAVLIVFSSLLFLTGCTSFRAFKISKSVKDVSYHQALALLNKQGAGENILPDAHPKFLKVRHEYQKAVEQDYGNQSARKLKEGKPRTALRILDEGLELCVWSTELEEKSTSVTLLLTKINLTYDRWKFEASKFDNDILITCRFLSAMQPLCHYLNDSPELYAMYEMGKSSLFLACTQYVKTAEYGEVSDEYAEIRDQLIQLSEEGLLNKSLPAAVNSVVSLPREIDTSTVVPVAVDAQYVILKNLDRKKFDDAAVSIIIALQDKFDSWIFSVLIPSLDNKELNYDSIVLAEKLHPIVHQNLTSALKHSLATAYLHRAEKWQGSGVESLLTLAFLQRYEMLVGVSDSDPKINAIQQNALSALNNSMPITHNLLIDVDDSVDPDLHSVVRLWIFGELKNRTKDWHEWTLHELDDDQNTLLISVDKADWVFDGVDNLYTVSSQYVSHYEDVRNPMKDFYKNQISYQKITLSSAKSSYDMAISSHNYTRTQYSLNNVNYAKNTYINALNRYNSSVDQYNATPATISRPVVLPYTFKEGKMRLGWDLTVAGMVNEEAFRVTGSSIEYDDVRLGTKHRDTTLSRRRDDGIDIDFSVENSLAHLDRACNRALRKLNVELLNFKYALNSTLSNTERNILTWLLHPWGPSHSSSLELPSWATKIDIDEVLIIDEVSAPRVYIADSNFRGSDFDAESLNEACGKFVCQILIMNESGTEQRGHGSGTLISSDGLILTCAHVVEGSNFKIKFPEGEYEGTYEASVVYVNNKRDCALLRAVGLSAEDWANVRLGSLSVKGEKIIAIGNPSLSGGGVNELGISQGIVSNPEIDIQGSPQLVADISIASGSSGGPLFSAKDGTIVGVVLAVASEQITDGHGASGYTCLAAPALRLSDWIGLTKTNIIDSSSPVNDVRNDEF